MIPVKSVRNIINRLKDEGKIKHIEPARGGCWEIKDSQTG